MAEADPTDVAVHIFGKNYTFASDRDLGAEHILLVAQLVDEKMRAIAQSQGPALSPRQTAILAGMDLVDELFKLQTDYQSAESDIVRRTSRLVASLDRAFRDPETKSS
jgi:cell division protein ZapA (FtsZ GTPase activity inhibitor)